MQHLIGRLGVDLASAERSRLMWEGGRASLQPRSAFLCFLQRQEGHSQQRSRRSER